MIKLGIKDFLNRWVPPPPEPTPAPAPEPQAITQPLEQDVVSKGVSSWYIGNGSTAGVTVTNNNVSRISAVASCILVLSQDLAKLPINVFEQVKDAKRLAVDADAHRLLNKRPNPLQTPFQFKQLMFRSLFYRGNAFAQIQKSGANRIIALYFLHPDSVQVRLVREGDRLVKLYDVYQVGGRPITLQASEIIHLMGDSDDGITGNSPIKQHALAFGLAMATAEFGAKFFENGAHSALAVVVPVAVAESDDEDNQQRFKDQFEKRQGGMSNAGKPIYLEPGGDVKAISVTPEAAQYLESRQFSRSEVAGIFRVPGQKIGDAADVKYNNYENQELSYKNDGLMPWAVQFEEEALLKLFTEEEQKRFTVRFQFDALLRADRKTRAEAHDVELRTGQRTLNEVRAEDDLPPVEGGDANLVMTNMSSYQAMGKNGWAPVTPAAKAGA